MKRPDDSGGQEPLLRPIRDRLAQIESVPFLSGQAHAVTLIQGTWVRKPHSLGRRWTGYLQTGLLNDCGPGYFYTRRSAHDDKAIDLMAVGYTANPQLLLWIY
jgi:hypothetical protein